MKLTVIQPDILWENKAANLAALENLIAPHYGSTDLVVLPEMFSTGFSMKPRYLSEPAMDFTYNWMKNSAVKGNFGICGSYIVRDRSAYFNRFLFVDPAGETHVYDKRHLFSMGGENKLFTAGKNRVVFSFRGIRIAPFICYDLRFPVWSRNKDEYDLAVYAANWPEVRRNVWTTLLVARAIENQVYVAGSNRIGVDGEGIKYCGDSLIISPRGEILAQADENVSCSINAEISMKTLDDFRKKFSVMRDADNFSIML